MGLGRICFQLELGKKYDAYKSRFGSHLRLDDEPPDEVGNQFTVWPENNSVIIKLDKWGKITSVIFDVALSRKKGKSPVSGLSEILEHWYISKTYRKSKKNLIKYYSAQLSNPGNGYKVLTTQSAYYPYKLMIYISVVVPRVFCVLIFSSRPLSESFF